MGADIQMMAAAFLQALDMASAWPIRIILWEVSLSQSHQETKHKLGWPWSSSNLIKGAGSNSPSSIMALCLYYKCKDRVTENWIHSPAGQGSSLEEHRTDHSPFKVQWCMCSQNSKRQEIGTKQINSQKCSKAEDKQRHEQQVSLLQIFLQGHKHKA